VFFTGRKPAPMLKGVFWNVDNIQHCT
jgi:hypothetical protein